MTECTKPAQCSSDTPHTSDLTVATTTSCPARELALSFEHEITAANLSKPKKLPKPNGAGFEHEIIAGYKADRTQSDLAMAVHGIYTLKKMSEYLYGAGFR